MSKGSLFWAKASGKLGETVLYRAKGEQRTRTYVKNIKNPRTEGQMKNRIQLSNWTAMFRRLKPLLSKTFTNRPEVESGFNAFVKANKSRLRYAITKDMLSDCDYIPLGAKVASGSIICNIEPKKIEYYNPEVEGTPPRWFTQMMEFSAVNVNFGLDGSTDGGMNGGQIYQALTGNGNQMQLPSEFKVVVLYGSIDIDDETGEYSQGGMPLSYRIYDCFEGSESGGTFVGNDMFSSMTRIWPKVSNVELVKDEETTADVEGLLIGMELAGLVNSDVMGMIIYYENSNGKNANNAFIYGYSDAVTYAKDFSEGGDVFNDILAYSGVAASDVLSNGSKTRVADLTPYEVYVEPTEEEEGGEEEP